MTYDVRQFRRSVWLLLLLGIGGFALAAQSPIFFLLGLAAVLGNAWLTWTGRFSPLPRPLANFITLGVLVYIVRQITGSGGTPVMIFGQFILFLQLVKLWEQRGNRDWAQILVLSFLLMVAASMNTANLWFCVILVVYLFLLLYCCLLFQLKVEAEAAAVAIPAGTPPPSPEALRQDQRRLGHSMRRLTGIVSAVGVIFAIAVFIAFPRGSVGMLGPKFRTDGTLTGFSDQINFQTITKITQNHERIAFVKVFHNGQLVQGTQTLLLRGVTLNDYARHQDRHDWTRYIPESRQYLPIRAGKTREFGGGAADLWQQEVTLWPTDTNVLFALAGVHRVTAHSDLDVSHANDDGTLRTLKKPIDRIQYDVVSTNSPPQDERWQGPEAVEVQEKFGRIHAFARRPEVCGVDAQGRDLAQQRVALPAAVTPLDPVIAGNIEKYLRTHFTYTLDLTDEQQIQGADPLEEFLYTWKRGHCEYFAGAMTLMCQSLGMQARIVIGFKCGPENYNDFAQAYAVYESDAHAWVEVKTPKGWESFDPTSARTDEHQSGGLVAGIKHFEEFLELKYANAVIAYDAESRQSLIGVLETTAGSSGARLVAAIEALEDWMTHRPVRILMWLLVLLTFLLATTGGWLSWDRWRLRRRAHRIGIESLPQEQQLKLARQLGFYDELVRLLEARRIVRPPHYTPLEFSRSLSFLPAGVYDTVLRLTRLFYSIRYGGAELTATRQRRLDNVLARLTRELDQSVPMGE